LLREQGIEPEIIKYLQTPPDAATIEELLSQLEMEPREIMRKKEKEYKELGLADTTLSRKKLVAAMASHPRLIERPIVVSEKGTVLGRPTEKILEIL
jgi:arsenate reductase (glutaredoxin)